MKASFSAPRAQHLLRCSPSVGHAALDNFDELLRTARGYLTNCDLSDSEWIQATLPVRDGGHGVRRVSTLAHPAFWLRRLAPCASRTKFASNVSANRMIHSLRRTCHYGHRILELHPQVQLPIDRQFGTDLVFMPLRMSCNPPSLTLDRRPRFWQPLLLTQVTGSMPYPSLPGGCVWTMRQSE